MSTVASPRQHGIIIEGKVVIPSWVDDLASFRAWRVSADAPTTGDVAYLGSDIWVDLSMEEFLTHNQVKAAFDFAIMGVVQAAASGRYVPDRMLLTNESAELSTEPDGLFFAWETVTSGRLRLVEKADQGIMELEGCARHAARNSQQELRSQRHGCLARTLLEGGSAGVLAR